jgi:hypothetical protein
MKFTFITTDCKFQTYWQISNMAREGNMSLGGKQQRAAGDSHQRGGNAIEHGGMRWPN